MTVSAHIHFTGKAETCLLHPPDEIFIRPNICDTSSVTDKQGKLQVHQSIHQDPFNVLKPDDLCCLLWSDTFSMSLYHVVNTLSCAVRWLQTYLILVLQLNCIVVHIKSAICFGSEILFGIFHCIFTVCLFPECLAVRRLNFCYASFFFSHQEFKHIVRHHSTRPPNPCLHFPQQNW